MSNSLTDDRWRNKWIEEFYHGISETGRCLSIAENKFILLDYFYIKSVFFEQFKVPIHGYKPFRICYAGCSDQ